MAAGGNIVSLIAVAVVVAIIAGGIGYYAGMSAGGAGGAAAPEYKPPTTVKAAWIYVGPIGDFGWSYMHDQGRAVAQALFKDWLETTYVESVTKDALKQNIENLIGQGYTVIFTTSFDFMEGTKEEADLHPDVMFFHCSGYTRAPNMGTYFADLYQIYYLNGLMAGALTKTGHIGYVAAYLIPEVVRHINAFALGAKEVGQALGKDIQVHVIELGSWYDPQGATNAFKTLVNQYNVDVVAYTEDSTAIIKEAQRMYEEEGKLIYVFSHYSPMYSYGPDVVVSGQLVRWEVIYVDILAKIKAGIYRPGNLENVDYWYLLNTGAVELGAHVYDNGSVMMINPKFIPQLKNITVTINGHTMTVYDLVMLRYEQMKNAPLLQPLQGQANTHKYENIDKVSIKIGGKEETMPYPVGPVFEPFTGPLKGYKLKDNSPVNIPAGKRLSHDDLWNMDWFLDFVHKH